MLYDLFLSYYGPDRETVRTVQQLLEARGARTFLDRDHLVAGLPWPQALERALGSVRAVAVFLSGSDLGLWQKREVGFALERQVQQERDGQTFPVIPVLLPGADPTPSFLFLNTWVDLRHDPSDPAALEALVRAVRGEVAPPAEGYEELCPYRGLQVFREEDAALFFGREAFVEQLRESVLRQSLVAIVGPSGGGKSSVVQAGLLPLLRRQRPPAQTWDALVFTPGGNPFHQLATELVPLLEPELGRIDRLAPAQTLGEQLASGDVRLEAAVKEALKASAGTDRLLVVADQFEELFTLVPEAVRQNFVQALLGALGRAPVTVLLTLRADFYGHAIALSRNLSDQLGQAVVNLGPMRREELAQAIIEPARRVGLRFEPGLSATILDDVANQPGTLPLLEHALLELWERRRDGQLTLEGYQASGGVAGAIAHRAEAIYGRFTPEEQAIARRVLLRLTQPGEGTEDTRRRATLTELVTRPEDQDAIEGVVQSLADARLLTTSGQQAEQERWVDVAHEALIRGWPELREWLEQDREGLRVHRRLTETAREWQQANQDEGLLYRGARLATAGEWRERNESALNTLERAFLDASVALHEREHQALEAAAQEREAVRQRELAHAQALAGEQARRADQQSRSNRRLRLGAAVLALVALLALAAAGLAVLLRQEADRLRVAPVAQALSSQAGQQQQAREDERAALLARQAYLLDERTGRSSNAQAAESLRSVLAIPFFSHIGQAPDGWDCLGFTAQGTGVVTNTPRGLWLWSAPGTTPDLSLPPGRTSPIFSADGRLLAVASWTDEGVRILQYGTNLSLAGPIDSSKFVVPDGCLMALGEDPRVLAAVTTQGDVLTVDYAVTGNTPTISRVPLTGAPSRMGVAAFSRDGQQLAVAIGATDSGNVALWTAWRTNRPPAELRGEQVYTIRSVAFSPDGKQVAAAGFGLPNVWNLEEPSGSGHALHGTLTWSLGTRSVAFSPDGALLAVGGEDKVVRLWDLRRAEADATILRGHEEGVKSVAFAANAEALASGSSASIRVWDLRLPGPAPLVLRGHDGPVSSVAFDSDGGTVASGGYDGTVRLWDWARSVVLAILSAGDQVNAVAFSPDGMSLAAGLGHRETSLGIPDLALWDVHHLDSTQVLTGLPHGGVNSVSFSRDGRWLAAGNDLISGDLQLWNLLQPGSAAIKLSSYPDYVFASSLAFTPNGETLVAGGSDGIWLIDLGGSKVPNRHPAGYSGAASSVAVSPLGGRFAAAGSDNAARVWTLDHPEAQPMVLRHDKQVTALAFGPDGLTLATGGIDGSVQLWDVTRPDSVPVVLRGHSEAVTSLAFAPIGGKLASSSNDATIRLWDVVWEKSGGRLADAVCEKVWRNLTLDEWKQFVGELPYERTCPNLAPGAGASQT
jgi:WD40 repeat protein